MTVETAIDPADSQQVTGALLAFLRSRLGDGVGLASGPATLGRGFDTFIYGFRASGDLPDAWRRELVLRLYPSTEQVQKAEREGAIQGFAARRGYPALEPLALDGNAVPFGLSLMIMPRVKGATVLDGIRSNPFRAKRLLAGMADLHVELHAIPIDGCPLPYERPLVETFLAETRAKIEGLGLSHMDAGCGWLEAEHGAVATEEPVLVHNDFHPLNILVDASGAMTVIDWSNAAVGDRHCDVAATIGLMWFAQIAATSAIERTALRLARGFLRGSYYNRYRSRVAVDERRIAYWEAMHTFRGWAQLEELSQVRASGAATTEMAARIPASTLGAARERFWWLTRQFSSV
ncbi:MAG: aminoglycoside phosphotransferase family protein [Chloroflexi bacterium]|nr:aminoglycoside phosphotransferase family protein [Chloroflexota bacterium]